MNTVDVSIIIPVYNASLFLDECISSIVNQKTSLRYEALFVNDGSTDNSLEILKKWASKSSVVQVIDKVNAGPSSARNRGLDLAKGKFVLFVDSDDWVSEHYVEDFRDYIDKPGCGIVLQGFCGVAKINKEMRSFENLFFRKREIVNFFDAYPLHRNGFPFAKLFNLFFIKKNNLRFHENVRFSEDLIFFLDYLNLCDWFAFDNHVNYFYRRMQDGSLVSSYGSFENEISGYLAFKKVFTVLESQYNFSEKVLNDFYGWICFFAMRSIKTIYRKGKHFLVRKRRIELLQNSFDEADKTFFKSRVLFLKGLDKLICRLMYKKKIRLLDCYLRIFFWARYNSFGNRIVKLKLGNQ